MAKVSKSTASRILNDDVSLAVREDTRMRVKVAAEQLHYRAHAGARGVRRGLHGAVSMLIPDFTQPIYTKMVRGAVARANERGVVVLVGEDPGGTDTGLGGAGGEAEAMVARMISERRIDGLIMASVRPCHPVLRRLAEAHLPHVFINRRLPGSGCNVSMDDALASQAVVDHLGDLGHRRIAMLAGPNGLDPSERRVEGFRRAMERNGCNGDMVVHASFTPEGGNEATRQAFQRWPDLTALYTNNFGQSMGALSAMRDMGIRIPLDCSVIGYDNLPLAAYLEPPLTAVDMPLGELGAVGLDALLDQLAGRPRGDVVIQTRPTVVQRASTGPAPF